MAEEKMLSWARYLYWCELMRRRWDTYMSEKGSDPDKAEWLGLTAHWYASLFVVVEGWEDNRFTDEVIEKLLAHAAGYKDLLRRFRNAVFHYQPSLIEPRMIDFLRSDDMWPFILHDEFCRFFRDWVDTFPGSGEPKRIYLEQITEIVGWIPNRPAEQEIQELEQMARQAAGIVASDGQKAIDFGWEQHRCEIAAAIKETQRIAARQRSERLLDFGIFV